MDILEDFYPTPETTIERLLGGIKIHQLKSVLDVGAGRGDISDFIKSNPEYGEDDLEIRRYIYRARKDLEIDVIEINPDLQRILKSKEYRLIHDDFLSFNTYKHYDLIVGNFPFSIGAECLAKALNMVRRSGGVLRCFVNAETVKNPFSSLRRSVVNLLDKLGAEIEYLPGEFLNAERKTDVEIALVKVAVQKPEVVSVILDDLRRAKEREAGETGGTQALAPANFVGGIVANFNVECELGIKFIGEYYALKPFIKDRMPRGEGKEDYSSPIIELKIGSSDGKYRKQPELINEYLRQVRHKYWEVLLRDERFHSKYTSNILKELESKLTELKDYDFTEFNIRTLEKELDSKISKGIEDSILKMFDEFSRQFSYHSDSDNIHYYNGWKTNKAWKINEKIILPINGFSSWKFDSKDKLEDRYVYEKLEDIVKVFNYLSAAERLDTRNLIHGAINQANNRRDFRGMDLRYFETTFYKKGTCHIKFKDKRLLDKLNIYGSQRKGWLPPSYGKKQYDQMEKEEKAVIDDFQGRDKYDEVMKESAFYLIDPATNQLNGRAALTA